MGTEIGETVTVFWQDAGWFAPAKAWTRREVSPQPCRNTGVLVENSAEQVVLRCRMREKGRREAGLLVIPRSWTLHVRPHRPKKRGA